MEIKSIALADVDIKLDGTVSGTFAGYASVFNSVDAVGDTILPGAYADTLKNRQRPVLMRWNHNGPVIGKWLSLEEDGKGLLVRGELTPGHSVAQDVYASMKHGSIDGLSIGYRIPPGGSEKSGRVRALKRIDLVEISPVEMPADTGAKISDVKSAIDEIKSLADAEDFLRQQARLSQAAATALVSQIKALVTHGERDDQNEAAAIVAHLKRLRVPGA